MRGLKYLLAMRFANRVCKTILIIVVLSFLHLAQIVMAAEPPFDSFFWLEEVEGTHSIEWVKQQNTRTVSELETDPNFKTLYEDAKAIYFAKDRVPFSSFSEGFFWNFWQDVEHKHGIMRRTTYEEYRKEQPQWETILDFDALSKMENENWVYQGRVRLDRHSSRRLLYLSRGGKDAAVVREFDYDTRKFVEDGFFVPEAKSRITPIDENHLLIGTDFGEGSQTKSGYPRIIKLWKRGTPLSEAITKFEVNENDVSADAYKIQHDDKTYILFTRAIDFFNSETFLQEDSGTLRKLPLPSTAQMVDIRDGHVYIQLKAPLKVGTRQIPTNSIVRFGLSAKTLDDAQVLFTAVERQAIEGIDIRPDAVFVSLLDNIRSKVLKISLTPASFGASKVLPFPNTGILSFELKDEEDSTDFATISYTDHLTPQSQYRVHDEDESYRLELLKSAPTRFDSSHFEVIQNHTTSRDGTQVPYFVLKPKNLATDGSNPTILYGYGGFEVSLTPSYSGGIGKLWLERGGIYVIANIRGGGEFGPEWHQAALKENRQRAYDDFIAVAEDLIARKITSPRHLGIVGGSNGGLLTGAVMVQRPELFNAVLSQVPLLDMIRYTKLPAGASWIGEYGDPEIPSEYAYLLQYSPYQNVKPEKQYPKAMFTTSTKDDRVHPGHARKMVARMIEQGHEVFYYENINGGHAGSANLEESAYMTALEYTYLWKRLR